MKRKTSAVLLFCLFSVIINAQENSGLILTLDEAVRYALQNSRQIQSGAIDLGMQKRASDTAWNTFLPNVDVGGTINRANEAMEIPGVTITEKDHWTIGGSIGVSLNFNIGMIETIKAAKIDYAAGKITFEETQKQLERDVQKLFYSLLLMQESIKMSEENLLAAKNRVAEAEQNFRAGKISEIELLQTQVAYQNQQPEVLRAKQALKQNLNSFALLLGMKAGTGIQVAGTIERPAALETEFQITTTRTEQGLQKNIDALIANRKALNLQTFTPSLQLSYGLQPVASITSLTDGTTDPWQDNGRFSASLAWNLSNLLPFSANRQQAKDIDANIAKLRIAQTDARENAINEMQQLIDTLELSREQISALEANIALALRNYELTETAYRNGRTDLLNLQDAELSLNQARQGLLSEQFNYLSAFLDIEYLTGVKLR
ncbi:outer membrane protein [Spirochaetia bacterium]|nr:outer membrane protein [Spirochaetia bacterium]